MALYYDYTECDLKDVPNDVIETMIHVTMVIDVGEFTKKMLKIFFIELKYLKCLMVALLYILIQKIQNQF